MWKFSQNKVSTGIEEIDDVKYTDSYMVRLPLTVGAGTTDYAFSEIVYQGASLGAAIASGTVSSWTRAAANLDIIHVKGVFQPGQNVVGATTGTTYTLTNVDPRNSILTYDTSDNVQLQQEGNVITNFTETNPWGQP